MDCIWVNLKNVGPPFFQIYCWRAIARQQTIFIGVIAPEWPRVLYTSNFVRHGLTSSGYEEGRPCLTKYWKYISVNPNHTVSLSRFSFFKFLHLLIRSYQVPVLFICSLSLSHFLKFKVFIYIN